MRKVSIVAMAALLIVSPGSAVRAAAGSETVRGGGVPAAGAGDAAEAIGAVLRATSVEGRFVVEEVSGYFRPDAEVRFFDPQGEPVGRGRVHSVYGEEVYVDAVDVPEGLIASGFAVAMNYGDAEARKAILARREAIRNVKTEAGIEARQLQKEISKEQAEEQARRERWQEDISKTKMILDYQYSGYYYYGSPYPW